MIVGYLGYGRTILTEGSFDLSRQHKTRQDKKKSQRERRGRRSQGTPSGVGKYFLRHNPYGSTDSLLSLVGTGKCRRKGPEHPTLRGDCCVPPKLLGPFVSLSPTVRRPVSVPDGVPFRPKEDCLNRAQDSLSDRRVRRNRSNGNRDHVSTPLNTPTRY